ncbi:L-lysine 2,3-aminomutase (fragment) [Candidatus Desulfarcum epimagneticum]|uniref:L-lysine 2,3-aminomutase n=1 Tax=uncultured Desulfobacteraceae bacterium TaxID=218296 RepID=A0A484HEZ5_9BACT
MIHKYRRVALLTVSNVCAVYCRFCMRKRRVGMGEGGVSPHDIDLGLDYIKKKPEIREVILSGGDPLLLDDEQIDRILSRLKKIGHVEIIRIGSRTPATLPQRITPDLCAILRRFHPIFFSAHFNHPAELTPESREACARIADAGISIGNQTVLLKGVNDDPGVMARLFFGLLTHRVRPYYLFQADCVKGIEHLRTRVETGVEIMARLTRELPGLAIPRYVADTASCQRRRQNV